ncbi:TonB-dependent receptor [Aurantiacibacter xanthus]|uniref:TonB-dependent receptor n=1 Tax=Aurantiacibacter xanthus TaxID=1784712 RepID=A0A3A1P109_9SPHN|nr:TonB-dependent receptor [Aurantiacibacter xanthus]RIV82616.1 TonB-dependent receptor [Aurantiacibacter xanthus]
MFHFQHKGFRLSRNNLALATAISSVLCSGQVLAQDSAQSASADNQASTIIVTATMRSENLQDTPIAITAVTGEMLEARSQTSVYEIARQAPNVTLAPQGQGYGSTMLAFIRGVGQSDFIPALEPGVGIYVDDVYYSTITGSLVDLLDIGRVEVLRGPQGTLAGRNSIGGAVKIFSNKPTGDGSGLVSVTVGSQNRLDGRAMADFAVTDALAARVSVVSKNSDGFIKRMDYACTHPGSGVPASATLNGGCELGTLGGKSLVAGRLYLNWEPASDLEIGLIGDITRDKSEAGGDVLRYANNPRLTIDDGNPATAPVPYDCRFVPYGVNSCDSAGPQPYWTYSTFSDTRQPTAQDPFTPFSIPIISHLDSYGLSGNITWRANENLELKSVTAYRAYKASFAEDADGSPIQNQIALQTMDNWQFTQELRASASFLDQRLNLTAGGFYFKGTTTFSGRFDLTYAGLNFLHGPEDSDSNSKALFLNGDFKLTESLRVSAGVRQSWDEKGQEYFRRNPDGTVPGTPCLPGLAPFDPANAPNCSQVGLNGLTDQYKGDRFDWRVAVDYRFSDAVLAYGQIGTGYRAGGVNPRPFFAPGTVLPVANGQIDPVNGVPQDVGQLSSFAPETITSYEVGLKTDLLDRRLRVNLAAFANDYKDIIVNLLACPITPCFQPNNGGTARVRGLEAELFIFPADSLSVDFSGSYLDFKYRNVAPGSGITLDMVTPFTPEWKASAGLQYDVFDGDAGLLSLRLDGSYQSEVYTEAVNGPNNRIDEYFLANARLTWASAARDWKVSLEVTNLGDKYYENTRFDQSMQSGTVSVSPGAPRQWAVTLNREF